MSLHLRTTQTFQWSLQLKVLQSRSMPLGLVAARSQRESSGVNQHVRRSRSRISMRTFPIVGFPHLIAGGCPNGHTQAIWHLHSGTPQFLSDDPKLPQLLLRTVFQGSLARTRQLAKEWQQIGQRVPYGQSWPIIPHYWCFLLPLIMIQPITTGFSRPQRERVCFPSAYLDPSHIQVFLATWWNTRPHPPLLVNANDVVNHW